MKNFQALVERKRQKGAALIIGLLLMVVITVLAISGMNTATTELAMARNDQTYETAFQAAEAGLERALSQGRYDTLVTTNLPQQVTAHEIVSTTIEFEDSTPPPPDNAYSYGKGIAAYHFLATSQAEYRVDSGTTTDRDATAVHTQAFYKIGPASPNL